jgi:hypothetical protein
MGTTMGDGMGRNVSGEFHLKGLKETMKPIVRTASDMTKTRKLEFNFPKQVRGMV